MGRLKGCGGKISERKQCEGNPEGGRGGGVPDGDWRETQMSRVLHQRCLYFNLYHYSAGMHPALSQTLQIKFDF